MLEDGEIESQLVQQLRKELALARAAQAAAEQRALELAAEQLVCERKAINTSERVTLQAEELHKAMVGAPEPL